MGSGEVTGRDGTVQPRMRRPATLVLVLAAVAACVLPACRAGTVSLGFRPQPGDTFSYVIDVRTTTDLRLNGEPRQVRTITTRLRAAHTVVSSTGETVRVRVALSAPGEPTLTLLVKLDRFGQLTEVEGVQGGTAGLGLPEVFPAAAGAPPARPLEPGEAWVIDDDVRLPGTDPARLTGSGRIRRLEVDDGRKLATVESKTLLPIRRVGVRQRLSGQQTAVSTATLDVADGSVQVARSTTEGRFAITLEPPPGDDTPPVRGQLTVKVNSNVRRTA
jgi:hypothetical protein